MKSSCLFIFCHKRPLFLWLFILLASAQIRAESGYRIRIQIGGIADTVCYLANYFGDKTYLTDTARVDHNGSFVFEGDSALPGGIYIVAGQSNNKFFELLIDDAQHFSVKTSTLGIPGNLEFKNSFDNEKFYFYVNENILRRKKIEEISLRIQSLETNNDSAKILKEQVNELYKAMSGLEDSIIAAHPGRFVSIILKARQEPALAPARYLDNEKVDSIFAYQSFKDHFWDNLNPADERLLRTPLYHKRLKNYFEDVVYQHPDTLILEADRFIEKAGRNRETFKYAVWYLTYTFETSNIMGFDEIFVHMVDAYYAKGLAYWADASTVKSLMIRADELRKVLIGNKAPDLILLDTAGSFRSLYSIESNYTVVLFYEYSCGHCLKEIKKLKEWSEEDLYGAEIFAVSTDTSLAEWKKFIVKQELNWIHVNATRSITPDYHGLYDIRVTPTIYLLDDRKKIIAKRLKTEQMIPFLERYHKLHYFKE